MDTLDSILLGVLCSLIGAGFLFRQRQAVRFIVVFLLFCISFGSVMSLAAFGPRLATSQHEWQIGQSSKDFREGASSATKIAALYYPYVLLSIFGLALMALTGRKKGRDNV